MAYNYYYNGSGAGNTDGDDDNDNENNDFMMIKTVGMTIMLEKKHYD